MGGVKIEAFVFLTHFLTEYNLYLWCQEVKHFSRVKKSLILLSLSQITSGIGGFHRL